MSLGFCCTKHDAKHNVNRHFVANIMQVERPLHEFTHLKWSQEFIDYLYLKWVVFQTVTTKH